MAYQAPPIAKVTRGAKVVAAAAAFVAAMVAFLISRQVGTVIVGQEDAANVASFFGLGVFPVSYPWLTEKITARQLGSRPSQLPPSVFQRPWFVTAILAGLLLAAAAQLAGAAMGFLTGLLGSWLAGVAPEMNNEFILTLLAGGWVMQVILAFVIGRNLGDNVEGRHAWFAIPLLVGTTLVAVLVVDRVIFALIEVEAAAPDPGLIGLQSLSLLAAAGIGYVSGPRLPELSYLKRALPTMSATDREALVALTYAHVAAPLPPADSIASAGEPEEEPSDAKSAIANE